MAIACVCQKQPCNQRKAKEISQPSVSYYNCRTASPEILGVSVDTDFCIMTEESVPMQVRVDRERE